MTNTKIKLKCFASSLWARTEPGGTNKLYSTFAARAESIEQLREDIRLEITPLGVEVAALIITREIEDGPEFEKLLRVES